MLDIGLRGDMVRQVVITKGVLCKISCSFSENFNSLNSIFQLSFLFASFFPFLSVVLLISLNPLKQVLKHPSRGSVQRHIYFSVFVS